MNILTDFVNILRNEPATLLAVIILASILFLIFLIPTAIKHSKNLKKTKFQLINWRVGKPVYAVAGLVLILTVLSTAFSIWTNKDYVAGRLGLGPEIAVKIGDALISLESVNTIAKHCKILNVDSKLEAAKLLVDDNVLSMWAADEGIVISKQEQADEELRVSGKQPVIGCTDLQARANLLREKLAQKTKKFREGQVVAANFIVSKADRTYADKLINSIYADLKADKLTFEQAVAKVRKDPRLGVKSPGYVSDTQGGPFTAVDYIGKKGLLNSESIRNKVDSLSEGQFSKPFLGRAQTGFGEKDGKLVDVRWIIVKVDRIEEGFSGTVEQLLDKTREKYDVKMYLR